MTVPDVNRNKAPVLLLGLSILLAFVGLAGFFYLFVLDFNVYWLFLAPVIIALYEIPAVFFLWLYKRKRAAPRRQAKAKKEDPGPGQP